jgi:carboxyl-terminal processing protease
MMLGKVGDVVKIDLGGGRFAFVPAHDVSPGGSPAAVPFDDIYVHAPPALEVHASATATRDDKVKIVASASDPERILDVFVFVGSRKLYYRSNRDAVDPKTATVQFDAPLRPGVNLITVVARETPDTTTRRVLVVRKDAPDGSVLKTPRTDDPMSDGVEGESDE